MSRSVTASREEKNAGSESLGWWIALALVLSLALHYGFYRFALGFPVRAFSDAYYDEMVPRTAFNVDRVEIDARLLEDAPEEPEARRQDAAIQPIPLPDEDITLEATEIRAGPAPPRPVAVEEEAPRVDAQAAEAALQRLDETVAASLEQDLESLREALLRDEPASPARAPVTIPLPAADGGGVAGAAIPAGYSDLDALLAGAGGLPDASAPIFMPADLLFGYDEAFLRPEAISSLEKLGRLIQRHPEARFRIEGHTDSFGGDEYNQRLSLARAESVRAWLVENMGVDPGRVDTRGLGRSRPLVSPEGTIEEQQLNRRVEIIILKARDNR